MSAIVAGDILVKGSSPGASAGNATANGGPDTNLGKYASSGSLATATLNSVFTDATGAENAASLVTYQCIFIHNNNGANDWQSVVAWISAETASGASIAIGVDTTAALAVGSATQQGLLVANRTTAPVGVTFSSPTTQGAGISLGTIPVGFVKALWIRRTLANTGAVTPDDATLSLAGDTGAL